MPPLSAKKALILLSACVLMGAAGVALLGHVHTAWSAQELWLKPRFSPKRLLIYEAHPSEFIARLLFIGVGGLVLLSMGAAGVLGLIERTLVLRGRFSREPFRSVVAVPFALLSLAGFCVWLVLLFYLPFKYG